MTKARKATLQVLLQADRPLSANEISERIEVACNPVTIYRTLHYLEHHGYADSFVLHCSEHGTERYYTAAASDEGSRGHHHWFHCERCHTFIDLGDCRISSLIDGYEQEMGIQVTGHTLYLTGI
ncbi:MAG TPA: transcriptional repressor, partial [Sphaerochaetaceae bacterium]|nr:transcriptional repressor [Sphaerochaetaceae bacterium]